MIQTLYSCNFGGDIQNENVILPFTKKLLVIQVVNFSRPTVVRVLNFGQHDFIEEAWPSSMYHNILSLIFNSIE